MKWTAEKRKQLAAGEMAGGFAGPDESFPIHDASDVADAWGLAGQAANADRVRRNIIRIAKRLKLADALPDTAKEWAEEHNISVKAANMADWLESRIHSDFTALADNLFGDGYITREERIALSNGIGDALDAFHERLQQDDLAALHRRRPYEEVPPAPPMMDTARAVPDMAAVKALGENRIGGYAVLWGNKAQRDLTREYFDANTEETESIFATMKSLPLLYHHAMDNTVKAAVVGTVDVLQRDNIGIWYEAQLAQSNKYRDAIRQLVSKGALGTSTGTLPGARKATTDGRIARWPIVEVSLTPTPAEPRMMERPVAEIKAAFQALGLNFDMPQGDGSHPAQGAGEARGGDSGAAVDVVKRMLLLDEMAWDGLEIDMVGTNENAD